MNEHQKRIEASVEKRTDAAKEWLRVAQLVLTAYVEGLTTMETARRIQRSRITAWRFRVVLGLETGRRWEATGKRTGRRDTRAALMEARP